MSVQTQQQLSDLIQDHGWTRFGWVELSRPFSFHLYEDWIKKGFQGEMDYLRRHATQKGDPTLLAPRARTALMVAEDYFPHPWPANHRLKNLRTALYARGEDYHLKFQEKLDRLCETLKRLYPEEVFVASTDSKPVLERDLAARAGLGWIGKNTCLIDQKAGSLFFIGEIISSLAFTAEPGVLSPDLCGKCNRCIEVCPTGALTAPRVLDARICISYLNIELNRAPDPELRGKIHDWFFGCDLCQTVCPWNEKAFGREVMRAEVQGNGAQKTELEVELKWILESEGNELEAELRGSPLLRRGAFGLKKNALLIIGNLKLRELKPTVLEFLKRVESGSAFSAEKKNTLLDLGQWTLLQFC